MKIVVDINHPAHVHFFKNFVWEMERKGHEILITAREKEVTYKLLDNYGFNHIKMGSYRRSLIKKLINIPAMDLKMYNTVKGFKPDIFVGLASSRAAHVSFLLRKKCINFDDTEHAIGQIWLYLPFVNTICTPSCFKRDLGKKQVRYNGYHELAYLHPNYFKPDLSVLDNLGLSKDDRLIIIRFVSWEASHDIGEYGFTNKEELVRKIEDYGRPLITSEQKLSKDLEKYKITIPPERIHDLLYYATMYIGEGATMASEAAVLGTPAIYVNTQRLGYLDEEEEKYGLVYNFSDPKTAHERVIKKAIELLEDKNLKNKWQNKKERLLNEKIDVTKFMTELIESQ